MPSSRPRSRRIGLLGPLFASGVTHAAVLGVCVLLGVVFARGGPQRVAREYVASFAFPEVQAGSEEPPEERTVELPPEPAADPTVVESVVWAEAEPLHESEPPAPVRAPSDTAWFELGELELSELSGRPTSAGSAEAPPPVLAPSVTPPVASEPRPPAPVRTPPLALHTPAPPYPRLSRRAGEEGSVLVLLVLDAAGEVTEVQLLESSGHGRLDEATLETLRGWRFEPAREDGRPVPTTIQHRVTFRFDS